MQTHRKRAKNTQMDTCSNRIMDTRNNTTMNTTTHKCSNSLTFVQRSVANLLRNHKPVCGELSCSRVETLHLNLNKQFGNFPKTYRKSMNESGQADSSNSLVNGAGRCLMSHENSTNKFGKQNSFNSLVIKGELV